MERLTLRSYAVAGVLLLAGLSFQATARATGTKRSEDWMKQTAISSFGDYRMIQTDPDDSSVSYKMDAASYKELRPFGIVARVLGNARESYDTVLIASNDKASFHDPRVCFTAQGWVIAKEAVTQVPTKSRGTVPVTLATMVHDKYGKRPAVFFYKGPEGFSSTTTALKIQMLKTQFFQGTIPEGVFYRFMPSEGSDADALLKFVGAYLDASGKATNNYF